MEELRIKNRIAILSSRQKENGKIVKKLQRRLRRIENTKQND